MDSRRIKWDDKDPIIHDLMSQGKSTNQIAKAVGVEWRTLANHLERDLGLTIKKNGPRSPTLWVSDTEIECSSCHTINHFSYHRLIKPDLPYRYTTCDPCRLLERTIKEKPARHTWSYKISSLRSNSSKRKIPFDLSPEYLEFVYEIQKCLCVYTSIQISIQNKSGIHSDCLSVDRFDTSQGYIEGNILLCSNRANAIKRDQTLEEFKEWMPSWYESGLKMLGDINIAWSEFDKSTLHPYQSEELK